MQLSVDRRKEKMREKALRGNPHAREEYTSKLHELEKKLSLFMLNTEESFVLVDMNFNIVTFNHQFNKLYSKFFGRPVQKGDSILNYAQRHTVPALKKLYKQVFSGEKKESELEISLKNGKQFTFLLKYKPAYDEDKTIIGAFVSSQDITEIKKARKALMQSEDKYRSIIEHSLTAVLLTIPDAGGTILQANKAAVDMFGYSARELEKLTRNDLFVKDSNMAAILSKRKNEGKSMGELTGIRKNGERFPCEYSSVTFLDIDGNMRATTSVIDISDRKKAEDKLREKEEHLRAIINNEPECVCLVDPKGTLLEINPAGLRLLQVHSEKTIIGKKVRDFILKEDQKLYSGHIKRVCQGHKGKAIYRMMGSKGKISWLEANSVPLKDRSGKIYAALSIVRDITQRIRDSEKIRESENNLRAIFDNSTEGLMLLDEKGRLKAFNAKATENHMMHNVRYDLEIGKKLVDFIDDDRKTYFKSLIRRVLKGESLEYDIDYAGKDGGKRWFHASLSPVWEGKMIKGVCIARSDISERKVAEQKIREAIERYNLVSKATNDSIYDWDLVTGKVIRSGEGLNALFGYKNDEVNSDADFWAQRVHPEDYRETYEKLRETLSNPKLTICNGEYRFRKADGTYAYVFDKGFIIRNNKGEAIRLIGATQDLSELKANEQQLKELLNITRDQNKRLQNFAHIVSHNIRSHSSNIIGLMELLGDHEDGKMLMMNNLFTMLKTSTHKLAETIENLNDIITVQNEISKEKKTMNLCAEIDKTCSAINVLISQTGTKIDNRIPEDTTVNVIPSYLESILLNLITNAIKYRSPEREARIEFSCTKTEDYLVLSIKDNGIGIDMEKNRDKLFGMYKTFHTNKDARGFGLFITKNQIEAMNGKIEAESMLGKGTTFKLYIYEKN